ncbi:response regulator transcription factor [Chloroflexota bacterium]
MKELCILVVDDELSILKFVSACLRKEGYKPLLANNGEEALRLAEEENLDLVVLDIMMAKMDGFEVCRRLRQWSQVPIIMLSARDDERDKVRCLDLGADDYITKPFGVDELLARVRAVLRRTATGCAVPPQPSFTCDHIEVNFVERRVIVAGREVKLTPTEYSLLQELVLNANKVLTHGMLLGRVWGPEYGQEKEYVRVFIGRLRKELEPDPENPRYIITIPHVGYRFEVEHNTKNKCLIGQLPRHSSKLP